MAFARRRDLANSIVIKKKREPTICLRSKSAALDVKNIAQSLYRNEISSPLERQRAATERLSKGFPIKCSPQAAKRTPTKIAKEPIQSILSHFERENSNSLNNDGDQQTAICEPSDSEFPRPSFSTIKASPILTTSPTEQETVERPDDLSNKLEEATLLKVKDDDTNESKDQFVLLIYITDIYRKLKRLEEEQAVRLNYYLSSNHRMTENMRAIQLDWMFEIQQTFQLLHETAQTAIAMLDRFLQNIPLVLENDLQWIGCKNNKNGGHFLRAEKTNGALFPVPSIYTNFSLTPLPSTQESFQQPVTFVNKYEKALTLENDSDHNYKDELLSIYVGDVCRTLTPLVSQLCMESSSTFDTFYLSDGHQMTETMTTALLDWVSEAQQAFQVLPKTAQNLTFVRKGDLQLMLQLHHPGVCDLVLIYPAGNPKLLILAMERILFNQLYYNIVLPTPEQFLKGHCRNPGSTKYFIDPALIKYQLCHVPPSLQSDKQLPLSLCLVNDNSAIVKDDWAPRLTFSNGYLCNNVLTNIPKDDFPIRGAPRLKQQKTPQINASSDKSIPSSSSIGSNSFSNGVRIGILLAFVIAGMVGFMRVRRI